MTPTTRDTREPTGWWAVAASDVPRYTPETSAAMQDELRKATARGDQRVVIDGITMTWHANPTRDTRDTRPDPEARVDALARALGAGDPDTFGYVKEAQRILAALSADGWRVEREALREAAVAMCQLWFTDNAADGSQHLRKAMLDLRAALGGPDAAD